MRSFLIAIFNLMFLVGPVGAQQTGLGVSQTPLPGPNKDAELLMNRAFAAITANTVPITDISLTCAVHRIAGGEDETGTATLRALATGESRMDFTFPSGQRSEVHANSTTGPIGSWSGPDGIAKGLAQFNILVDSAWFSPDLVLSKLVNSKETVASAVSSETRSGAAIEHLTLSRQFPSAPAQMSRRMQRDSQMEVYLDASSLLPQALDFNTHPDTDAGRNLLVEIRYSDYKAEQGLVMPFHIQQYVNGALALDLQVQRVELNSGLSPAMFIVPESALATPVFRTSR